MRSKGNGRKPRPDALRQNGDRRAKKEPLTEVRSSFAAPRTPFRVDAEAPGQAPELYRSANVRHCQGLAPKKAQRQGQGREPPGLTLARSRYNGKAHGLTKLNPGEQRSCGGRSPQPQAPGPRSPPAGGGGRGGARGEPHRNRAPPENGTAQGAKHPSKKRARGGAKARRRKAAKAPGEEAPGPKPRRGRGRGAPPSRPEAQRRPRREQGRPQEARSAQRGRHSAGTAASGHGAAQRRTRPERTRRGAAERPGDPKGRRDSGAGRGRPQRTSRASTAQHGGRTRSGEKATAGRRPKGEPDKGSSRAHTALRSAVGAGA